jgi:hypothetical protein
VDLRGEYEPHGGTVTVESIVDGVSMGTQSVDIGTGLSVYGTAVYGTATYAGAGRRQFVLMHPLRSEGRTMVVRVQYVGQERWRLFSYHSGLVTEMNIRSFTE